MIHDLTGIVTAITDKTILIDLGSVGFSIAIPNTALCTVGSSQKLLTYMHWNQEQGPSLYGFFTELERTVFLLIITCSGIGPKIAMATLLHLEAIPFLQAVKEENPAVLAQVPGIGLKKAEQIIVHLKHKVMSISQSDTTLPMTGDTRDWHSLSQALESLKYSRSEISSALQYVKKHNQQTTTPFDQLLRQALSFLAKQL